MTVTHLERVLPYRELMEWMDEYRRDPWGTWRDNMHAASVCTVVANVFSRSRTFTCEDFMYVDPETAEKRRQERQKTANANLVKILSAMAG